LNDSIASAMNRNFHYVHEDNIDIAEIKKLKNKNLTLLPSLNKDMQIIRVYNLKKLNSILPLDAILMAGGKGVRLRPLTENTPKPLLKVGDKAIIDYNIDRLLNFGIKNISVTVNYLKEQIEEHFQSLREGVKINCVREPNFLGTIGSVKLIDTFQNDYILVMNSDLFTNINYEDFYLHCLEHEADMSVVSVPYSINVPYGIFELDGRYIKGISEKPTYNYYANAGIYLIKKSLLNLIPDDVCYNATDLIELLIKKEYKVIRFPLMGYWIDIGKHEDYKKVQELIKHI